MRRSCLSRTRPARWHGRLAVERLTTAAQLGRRCATTHSGTALHEAVLLPVQTHEVLTLICRGIPQSWVWAAALGVS
jgi:hypothetical protein